MDLYERMKDALPGLRENRGMDGAKGFVFTEDSFMEVTTLRSGGVGVLTFRCPVYRPSPQEVVEWALAIEKDPTIALGIDSKVILEHLKGTGRFEADGTKYFRGDREFVIVR